MVTRPLQARLDFLLRPQRKQQLSIMYLSRLLLSAWVRLYSIGFFPAPAHQINIGCRLPGDVDGPAAFWDLMINKNTGRTPKVPSSRFNIDAHFHENTERPGSFDVLGGYFLKSDLQEFDPVPFGVSPVEAMWMDPQQRKLLEVVYEAFENSGSTLDDVSGTVTAVFAGSFTSDFQQMSFKEPDFRHSYAATGVDPGIISNRISHVFNLHGPRLVLTFIKSAET